MRAVPYLLLILDIGAVTPALLGFSLKANALRLVLATHPRVDGRLVSLLARRELSYHFPVAVQSSPSILRAKAAPLLQKQDMGESGFDGYYSISVVAMAVTWVFCLTNHYLKHT